MKARFFLKNDKVSVYVTIAGTKHKYATGIDCKAINWDKGYPKRNQTLTIEQVQKIEKPLNEYLATSSTVTPHQIKLVIDEAISGKKENKESVKQFIDSYLLDRKDEVAKVTYEKIELHLIDFQSFAGKRTLSDLNIDFYDQYRKYLKKKTLNENSTEKLSENTLNSYIKNVQAFFNWMDKKGYINRKITLEKYEGKEKDIIAIDENELLTLTSSTGLSEKLERVRDLFLFGCYTGLRFSDLQAVNSKMINNNILTIRQQKTGELVQIPLIYEAHQLLEKYAYQLPQISNQKANKYIKELFKTLKLTRSVYAGATIKQLDEVVSFHNSRKSFITIALSKGMHAKIVQAISGHKKDEVFNKYIAFSTATLESEINKMSATHLRIVKGA